MENTVDTNAPTQPTEPTPTQVNPNLVEIQTPPLQSNTPITPSEVPFIESFEPLSGPQSDKFFNSIIGFIVILVISIGGYFIHQAYRGSDSLLIANKSIENESIANLTDQPALQKVDLSAYKYITPPEGDDVLVPATSQTKIPTPMRRYDNHQFSFSFEYEYKPNYQPLICTWPGVGNNLDSEDKFIFYDSTDVTSIEELYGNCSPTNTTHFAKVMFTQSPTECFGASESRTLPTGTAIQCSGKTSSTSSNDASLSLIIPKDSGSVLVEVNSPDYSQLIQDISATFSFETQEPSILTE